MRIRITFDLSAEQRRAIASAMNKHGLASYGECKSFLESQGMLGVEQAEADGADMAMEEVSDESL